MSAIPVQQLQQRVQQAIDDLVASGAETGVQVAVYRHGALVVDAVAGVADPASGRPVTPDTLFYNRPDVLTADIPAGGTMTARAVARMYAALLGEVYGVRLVSPERLRELSAVAVTGIDQVSGGPTKGALGYFTGRPGSDPQPTPTSFGVSGVGGSHADADTADTRP